MFLLHFNQNRGDADEWRNKLFLNEASRPIVSCSFFSSTKPNLFSWFKNLNLNLNTLTLILNIIFLLTVSFCSFQGKRWNEGKRILPFSNHEDNEAYGSRLNDILIEAFGEVKKLYFRKMSL